MLKSQQCKLETKQGFYAGCLSYIKKLFRNSSIHHLWIFKITAVTYKAYLNNILVAMLCILTNPTTIF